MFFTAATTIQYITLHFCYYSSHAVQSAHHFTIIVFTISYSYILILSNSMIISDQSWMLHQAAQADRMYAHMDIFIHSITHPHTHAHTHTHFHIYQTAQL